MGETEKSERKVQTVLSCNGSMPPPVFYSSLCFFTWVSVFHFGMQQFFFKLTLLFSAKKGMMDQEQSFCITRMDGDGLRVFMFLRCMTRQIRSSISLT